MEDFIIYLVKSSLMITILYCIYFIFLKKQKTFGFNRVFIYLSVIASVFFPIFTVSIYNSNEFVGVILLEELLVQSGNSFASDNIKFIDIISIIYFSLSAIFIVKLLLSIISIFRIRYYFTEKIGKCKILYVDNKISPFSFFNRIYIPYYLKESKEEILILKHELAHCAGKHSIDMIFFEIVIAFQWFNPFLWLLKKSMVLNNEFIADSKVISSGTSPIEYNLSILNTLINSCSYNISNYFNKVLLKRRLNMINNFLGSKRLPISRLIAICVISLITISALTLEGKPANSKQAKEKSLENSEQILFDEPPTMDVNMLKNSIVYPEKAKKKGLEGKVLVKVKVGSDGVVKDAKVEKSDNSVFNDNALKAIKNTKFQPAKKDGKPVEVEVIIPINFRLEDKNK